MHFESRVGHIGGNLSCFDAIMVLFHQIMKPEDSFILSKGHAAGALYIAQWSKGIIEDSELLTFHKNDSKLAGHPIGGMIQGTTFSTGSLGHGFGLAAGIALSKKHKKKSSRVFCLCSDGEWQEGSTWEALFFAAHQKINNLTILVDVNGLQGFGHIKDISSTILLNEKLSTFPLEVLTVDGHNLDALKATLSLPQEQTRIVLMNTVKGKGVTFMENQMAWHYLPLNEEQYKQAVIEIQGT
jgi:transketolase